MEQSEPPEAAPVVRQLDFTANLKPAANANARSGLILPDHPQAQLQSKLLALAQSRQVAEPARSQSPPRMTAQTKLPARKMVRPPKSPQRELPQVVGQDKLPAAAPRLAHPTNKTTVSKPPLQPLMKLESPKSREKVNLESNDSTPKKQRQCNCKNSRCLKLYCECFASGVYCDGCNCMKCHNKMEHEADRKASIEIILERNPNAFRPKIANSPHGAADLGVEHNKGCHCKKSGCLKRYCECFQANILCSDKCKCIDCKNYEGSEERKAHIHQYPANSIAIMQQAANAAINGAIGTPKKKSRTQQIAFGLATSEPLNSWPPHYHQVRARDESRFPCNVESCSTASASNSSLSHHPSKPGFRLSKPSYRSPLDGILQLQHIEDFCTLLVQLSSAEAAHASSKQKKTSMASNTTAAEPGRVSSSVDHGEGEENGEANGFEIEEERRWSPETLALMCDEQDTAFTAEKASSSLPPSESDRCTNMKSDRVYADQERLALTLFRDFLNRVITCGAIEEAKNGS